LPSFLRALGKFYLIESSRIFRFARMLLIRHQPRVSLLRVFARTVPIIGTNPAQKPGRHYLVFLSGCFYFNSSISRLGIRRNMAGSTDEVFELIRVLIADDHPLIRSGLKHLLQREKDFGPPGEAENSDQTLERIKETTWDIVVLDIGMPGRNGLETLSEIRRLHGGLPVLILSMHSEEQFALRAIKAGASGYVTKSDAPAELVRAIRRILSGKRYVSAGLAEVLANALNSGEDLPLHETLSDREYHVICRIASGKSISEIAEETSLSVKTISTYRSRALEKMKMHTNSELMRYAIRNGLID
jgi:two-component system, NarL family, invasion response regulator UvrY